MLWVFIDWSGTIKALTVFEIYKLHNMVFIAARVGEVDAGLQGLAVSNLGKKNNRISRGVHQVLGFLSSLRFLIGFMATFGGLKVRRWLEMEPWPLLRHVIAKFGRDL